MYNFCDAHPTTKRELRQLIVSWLKPPEKMIVFEHNGEWFRAELGFRRGIHSHMIYRNLHTCEFLWWATEDDFPIKRSDTFEHLLNDVVDLFHGDYPVK